MVESEINAVEYNTCHRKPKTYFTARHIIFITANLEICSSLFSAIDIYNKAGFTYNIQTYLYNINSYVCLEQSKNIASMKINQN